LQNAENKAILLLLWDVKKLKGFGFRVPWNLTC